LKNNKLKKINLKSQRTLKKKKVSLDSLLFYLLKDKMIIQEKEKIKILKKNELDMYEQKH
jgi:hypothetical protein